MAGSIERRNDGSIALSINDDLQFDSKDEHIYHEGLVLPALSLVEKRIASSLNVLLVVVTVSSLVNFLNLPA
jgi:predicted membrane-bound spermidine synthase